MANSINDGSKTGSTSGIDALGAARLKSSTQKAGEMGQDEFLKLMITQMKNQDPTKPMDSNEFVSQMAQFSQASGIKSLNTSFSSLAASLQSNQALQASSMVGRDVLVESDRLQLGSNGAGFAIDLPNAASEVQVEISDGSGQAVRTLALGQTPAGVHDFAWDGLAADGTVAPLGNYKVKVSAIVDGKEEAAAALSRVAVQSVTLPRNGATPQLNLADFGSVNMDAVRRVF